MFSVNRIVLVWASSSCSGRYSFHVNTESNIQYLNEYVFAWIAYYVFRKFPTLSAFLLLRLNSALGKSQRFPHTFPGLARGDGIRRSVAAVAVREARTQNREKTLGNAK